MPFKKRISLFLLFMLLAGHAFNQIPRFTRMWESGATFSGNHVIYSEIHKGSNMTTEVNGKFGKFYRDNLAMGYGASLGYQNHHSLQPLAPTVLNYYEYKRNRFEVGALGFMRKYVNLLPSLYLTVEANLSATYGANYRQSETHYYATGVSNSYQNEHGDFTTTLQLTPGIVYMLGSKTSLGISFGQIYYSNSIVFDDLIFDNELVTHEFGASLQASTFFFSFTRYFQKN